MPCALRLEADGELIALAQATDFCRAAAARGLRRGWCGVMLGGLDIAAALADTVRIYCVASGELLLEADAPAPSPARRMPLSVEELIVAMRRDVCDDDAALLRPFAEATLRRYGLHAMLDAAYRTLLGRPVESGVVEAWRADLPPDPAGTVLRGITDSPEFRDRPGRIVPDPFHPAFAFDRDLIDDRP